MIRRIFSRYASSQSNQQQFRGTKGEGYMPWLLFFLLGTVAWGSSFYWIKIALAELTPTTIVAWRFTFGAIFLWLFILCSKTKIHISKSTISATVVWAMIMMCIPNTLVTWAENHISSGITGLLNSLNPLFTLLFAYCSLQHRAEISIRKIGGMLLGFGGVLLIMHRGLDLSNLFSNVIAMLGVVLASACYAYGTLYSKSHLTKVNPIISTCFALSFSSIIMWLVTFYNYYNTCSCANIHITLFPNVLNTWIAITWLGIICSGAAFITYLYLIRELGAARTANVAYLFPLTAYLLGILLLDEAFSLYEGLGGICILSGIYIANKTKKHHILR